jgi:hypothetical protein
MMSLQDVGPILDANGVEDAGEGDGSSPEEPQLALRGQVYIGLGNMVVSGSQQDRSISLA